MAQRRIVFVMTPHSVLLDVTGPLQAFHDANLLVRDMANCDTAPAAQTTIPSAQTDQPPIPPLPYEIILASQQGGAVITDTGIALPTIALATLDDQPIDTLIIAGTDEPLNALHDQGLLGWLMAQQGRVRRVASICIGAFLLGEAGYLDGRDAVTHWRWCDRLQARFPKAQVKTDPIYVRDGPVWTSAGVTTGIDMAIAMIEEDLGRQQALAVARGLIMFIKRPGGQSQFSQPLIQQGGDKTGRFDELHVWMRKNLQHRLTVDDLAQQANMSPRNFSRIYARETGIGPAHAVESMRMDAARQYLENSDQPIGRIADLCGFGDDERMRRAFVKNIGVAPSDYRARFRN
ncbi:GlxA family transcriptional regulator [Thalassospira marina]|uniref:AraC family transcriptional regulator n=1 Tax=Thalassospira marina TaxID=2048283 RepID=A0ABM6QF36_9PROT|nr:helix-turn-helix domain-containing protein [Thalassospira marina]AUG55131.1 AraC family transcriptional regulator [Thalassospira marina]